MSIENSSGLSRARQQIYELGKEVAILANDAFDQERLARASVEELSQRKIPQSFFKDGPLRDAVAQVRTARTEYLAYSFAVGSLIGPDVFK